MLQELEELKGKKVLFVTIDTSISEGKDSYTATRFAWRVNLKRAQSQDYVVGVNNCKIVDIFTAHTWLPAGDSRFESIKNYQLEKNSSRFGFIGQPVSEDWAKKLIGQGVGKKYQNPVRYQKF